METPGEDVVVRSVESVLEGGPSDAPCCPNCGSDHIESYCAHCGQRAGSLQTPITAFIREVLDGLLSFDSRAWRTLLQLFRRPGQLTLEYWRGRRVRFVAPLRLYLFVSFFSFLFLTAVAPESVLDATGESPGAMVQIQVAEDAPTDLDDLGADSSAPVHWFVQRVLRPVIEAPERTQTYFAERLAWVFFLLLPVFAALLRLLYRRRERFFVPHLVFALHFFTATFILHGAGVAVNAIFRAEWGSPIGALAILVVLFQSLRRVYQERFLTTIAKQACLVAAHSFAIAIALLLLLIVTGLST